MRKFFLLIPALVLALAMNAEVIYINTETSDALRKALNSAQSGDIIEMAAGTYLESPSNYIAFTGKHVTVRAAEGAEVLIQPQVPITISEGGCAHFVNIKIDASHLMDVNDWYSHSIYPSDANENNRIILEGCEMYGFNLVNSAIYCSSSNRLDAVSFNNCYFHDMMKSVLFIESTAGTAVQIANSTFANIETSSSYSAGVIDTRATSGSFSVDHCTFYNCQVINTDYGTIGKVATPGAVVSNCIFAMPTSTADLRAIRDVAQANNCLTFNYTKDSGKGIHGDVQKNNCIFADPLFIDAANGDYSFAGNWNTMELSPARGAATDGSDLGDPRWYSAEVLPSSNFVAPYAFIGAKAVVRDNMELDGNNYIHSKSAGGSAIWKIHATRAGSVQVTLNMDPDGQVIGHTYHVEVFDADDHSIGEVNEGDWSNNVDDKVLSGTIAFPAEGDYKIVLTNTVSGTKSTIKGITLAYVGGAVVTVPAEELLGTEAVLVNDGSLKVSKLENGDLKYGDNGAPLTEYVYWNINSTKAGNMKVTLNVVAPTSGSASTHDFLVELYSDLNGSPIASSAEASATSGTGARVLPDAINIPAAGNYIVKLTNQTQWSSAILHSIQFEYLGGATITVPADALIGEEAVLVDEGHLKVSKLANGDLKYGDNGNPLDEYVYWNINATKYGRMNVTANVVAPGEGDPSGHQFLVELYTDLNASPIATSAEASSTSATGAIAMPALNIPATGNYIVKLTNQKQWSSAILHSIELEYAGGEVADVPGQIVAADAMLLKEDGGTLKMYLNENEDIKYNNNGYNLTEYALWNINATEAGEMIVTLNGMHAGHLFTVELYQGETLKSSVEEADGTKWDDGDLVLTDHLTIPAAGSYTIKLINRQQYSGGAIHGITFTPYVAPAAVTMTDTDIDNSAWVANVESGATVNVRVNRTILGGMYNTICLPFKVSGSQCKAIFGNDVELYTLGSASLSGDILNLQFNVADDIWNGTPILIKTSSNIVNPLFEGVVVESETADATNGGFVTFKGTFVQKEFHNGDQVLLLLANDMLAYPQQDRTLKGFRAYFQINTSNPQQVVKHARIIAGEQVVTAIDLVDAQNEGIQKVIENGQLFIIKNGVRYNVMGTQIQ